MFIQKRILCAGRVRRVPVSFSYVDHRLRARRLPEAGGRESVGPVSGARDGGRRSGLSYYSDRALGEMLALPVPEIAAARRRLEAADVIVFADPLYQVLALEGGQP